MRLFLQHLVGNINLELFKRTRLAVFTHGSNDFNVCVNKTKRILACLCVCVSDVEGLFDREDDVFDLRQAVVLQDFGIWHGDVNARHPGGRGVQVVESRT